ncbi:MAG: hypothetical protein CL526_03000 [Aequorivita sp.]|nr:hypothetical protein [Aequorivita sp.]
MKSLAFLVFLLPVVFYAQTNYQQAEDYFKQDNFGKAKPIFETFLKQNPHHKKTREYLGDIAAHSKDWDTAILYYKSLVNDDKNNANYHFKYGGVLGMKAISINKIRAVTYISEIKYHLQRANTLNPQHIEAHWALVEFYIQLPGIFGGSEKKAIQYANHLGTISAVDGYLANGYIAEYTNRPKDAEYNYRKAIEVGGSPHTYDKLSGFYKKNKQPNKAMDVASSSLKKHKRNQLNYQIGKIAAQYNIKPHYGIECLNQYLANYTVKDGVPKDWAYYRLAQIYKNLGKKEIALRWINKALLARADFNEAAKEKSLILAM